MENGDEDILIHPMRGKSEKEIPENGFLFVNPVEAEHYHVKLRGNGGEKRNLFHSNLTIASGNSWFLAGPSLGAPMAAMTLEKLIVLGAKRIILFGWCGAVAEEIKIGDTIIASDAIAGEGTSQYYPSERQDMTNPELTGRIRSFFNNSGLTWKNGRIWSTDAIFRESRKTLAELKESQGVNAVDMEFSALCAVAAFRKIEFASVLVVSDELWGSGWKPGFTKDVFLQKKKAIIANLLTFYMKTI